MPSVTIQIVQDRHMRMAKRESLNRLCDITDWKVGGELSGVMRDLGEGVYIHRKSWEYALCVHGLGKTANVSGEARAISVGAGYERPLYYFANRIKEMVATDLYDNEMCEGKPSMLQNPDLYAPFPYRRDHLTVKRMGGTHLDYDSDTFDFAFSLSSIEHFGSKSNSRKSVEEMHRVLKPNGVMCLATELVLNDATHPQFFTVGELDKFIFGVEGLELVGGDLDLRISRSLFENPIELGAGMPLEVSPHIVLQDGDVVWTSIMLFLKKTGGKHNLLRLVSPVRALRTCIPRFFRKTKGAGDDANSRRLVAARAEAAECPPVIKSEVSKSERDALQRDQMRRMDAIGEDPTAREQIVATMHHRYQTYIRELFLDRSGALLDLGCGYAEIWFGYLHDRGFTYYGLDFHEDVINFMTRLLEVQGSDTYVHQGYIEDIPFPDSFFDVVYASHILEHTIDIARTMSEIKRVMKDEGYLVFAVPCGPDDEPAHTYNRERGEWELDFISHGFIIERSGQFEFNLNEFYGRARKA